MTVLHFDDAIAFVGQRRIMGNQDQRRAGFSQPVEQQCHHGLAGRLIKIAGWFISENQRRPRGDSPGEADALLLAARKLGRIMIETVAKADRLQFGAGLGFRIGNASKF